MRPLTPKPLPRWARGLEFLHLSPFFKGIEALRKLRRVFCGRGCSLVCATPPVVPLPKGDKPLAFGQRKPPSHRGEMCQRRAEGATSIEASRESVSMLLPVSIGDV